MSKKIINLAERRQLWIIEDSRQTKNTPQSARLAQRGEEVPDENGVPGWAKDIPPNDCPPTTRKPDKCSGCTTPIWRWYQPDIMQPGEWRCVNCLIHAILYDKAGPVAISLEACSASGVYREQEYYWEEGE